MPKSNRRLEIILSIINDEAKRARAEEMQGFRQVAREADRQAKLAAKAQADATRQAVAEQAKAARQQVDLAARAARQQVEIAARAARQQVEVQAKEAARLANEQTREAVRAANAIEKEAQKLAAAQEREAKKAASVMERESKRAAAALARDAQKIAAQQAKAFDQAFVGVGSVIQSGFDLQDKLAGKTEESRISMASIGIATGITTAAIQAMLGVVMQLPDAFNKAYEASLKLGESFGKDRESLAELATTMGVTADNKFTVENAEFNRRAGFRFDEGLQYRGEFRNAGQQYEGTRMSAPEFAQYEELAGKLTLAKKIDPKTGGDFAGAMIGVKNYSRFGKLAAEEATGDYAASVAIMGRGQGNTSVNLQQAKELNAAFTNEDEFKGLINDPKITAMLVSAAAERNPSESATMIKAAFRGIRAFNDKESKPLLDKAGITPDLDPITVFRKLAPVVQAEAKEKKLKVDDVLKTYFPDRLTSEGIGVMINRGVGDNDTGVFTDREKLLKGLIPGQPAAGGVQPAIKELANFEASDRGAARAADAEAQAAQTRRGEMAANTDLLRKQAIARLEKAGDIGTTRSNLEDLFYKTVTLGTMDVGEMKINAEIATMLQERGKRAGVRLYAPAMGNQWTAEAQNEEYNSIIDRITKAGGDWKGDGEVKEILRDLPAKIAEAVRKPQNMPMVNPKPLPGRP